MRRPPQSILSLPRATVMRPSPHPAAPAEAWQARARFAALRREMIEARMRELHHSPPRVTTAPAASRKRADAPIVPARRRQRALELLDARRGHGKAQLVVLSACQRQMPRARPCRLHSGEPATAAAPQAQSRRRSHSRPQASRHRPAARPKHRCRRWRGRAAPVRARRAASGTRNARAALLPRRTSLKRKLAPLEKESRSRIPGVPERNTASPGARTAAAQRRSPRHVTEYLDGDAQRTMSRVAADQRHIVLAGERTEATRELLEPQPRRRRGSVSARSAQAGVAPIAAKSLKLTASARWPIEAAVACGRKCTPVDQGVDRGNQLLCRAASATAPHHPRCRAPHRARSAPQ